jgi:hypothetical protein
VDGVHVHFVDDVGTISGSAGTKEELDHCTGSAIKVRKAGYAQDNQQQQQGFAHELELKRLTLAYEDKKEARAHEEKKEARTHELEMARLLQQPSTPRQDSSRQNLFRHDIPADVHPQVMITPGATSRKRMQPMSVVFIDKSGLATQVK